MNKTSQQNDIICISDDEKEDDTTPVSNFKNNLNQIPKTQQNQIEESKQIPKISSDEIIELDDSSSDDDNAHKTSNLNNHKNIPNHSNALKTVDDSIDISLSAFDFKKRKREGGTSIVQSTPKKQRNSECSRKESLESTTSSQPSSEVDYASISKLRSVIETVSKAYNIFDKDLIFEKIKNSSASDGGFNKLMSFVQKYYENEGAKISSKETREGLMKRFIAETLDQNASQLTATSTSCKSPIVKYEISSNESTSSSSEESSEPLKNRIQKRRLTVSARKRTNAELDKIEISSDDKSTSNKNSIDIVHSATEHSRRSSVESANSSQKPPENYLASILKLRSVIKTVSQAYGIIDSDSVLEKIKISVPDGGLSKLMSFVQMFYEKEGLNISFRASRERLMKRFITETLGQDKTDELMEVTSNSSEIPESKYEFPSIESTDKERNIEPGKNKIQRRRLTVSARKRTDAELDKSSHETCDIDYSIDSNLRDEKSTIQADETEKPPNMSMNSSGDDNLDEGNQVFHFITLENIMSCRVVIERLKDVPSKNSCVPESSKKSFDVVENVENISIDVKINSEMSSKSQPSDDHEGSSNTSSHTQPNTQESSTQKDSVHQVEVNNNSVQEGDQHEIPDEVPASNVQIIEQDIPTPADPEIKTIILNSLTSHKMELDFKNEIADEIPMDIGDTLQAKIPNDSKDPLAMDETSSDSIEIIEQDVVKIDIDDDDDDYKVPEQNNKISVKPEQSPTEKPIEVQKNSESNNLELQEVANKILVTPDVDFVRDNVQFDILEQKVPPENLIEAPKSSIQSHPLVTIPNCNLPTCNNIKHSTSPSEIATTSQAAMNKESLSIAVPKINNQIEVKEENSSPNVQNPTENQEKESSISKSKDEDKDCNDSSKANNDNCSGNHVPTTNISNEIVTSSQSTNNPKPPSQTTQSMSNAPFSTLVGSQMTFGELDQIEMMARKNLQRPQTSTQIRIPITIKAIDLRTLAVKDVTVSIPAKLNVPALQNAAVFNLVPQRGSNANARNNSTSPNQQHNSSTPIVSVQRPNTEAATSSQPIPGNSALHPQNVNHLNPATCPQNIISSVPVGTNLDMEGVILTKILRPWFETSDFKSINAVHEMLKEQNLLKLYKCMEFHCSFCTYSEPQFHHHTLVHSAENSSVNKFSFCCYCVDRKFLGSELAKHITEEHGQCKYVCMHCFYRSVSEYSIIQHAKLHKEEENVSIRSITHMQPISEDDEYKKIRFTGLTRIPCVHKCNLTFDTYKQFTEHFTLHAANITFGICKNCGLQFGPDKFVEHLTKCYGYYNYYCCYCDKKYQELEEMSNHVVHAHKEKVPFYIERLDVSHLATDTVKKAHCVKKFSTGYMRK